MATSAIQDSSYSSDNQIDEICDAFELAWRTGQQPTLSQYLERGESSISGALFYELLLVEIEMRCRKGEHPRPDDYLPEFAGFASQILRVNFDIEDMGSRRRLYESVTLPPNDSTVTKSLVLPSRPNVEYFGRYRVIGVLGEGAFGRVYQGFDYELQRDVAIKVPTLERFRTPEEADSYLAEARNVASLDHPNIVPVHDVGRTSSGSIYVVSKLVNGCSLREMLKAGRIGFDEGAVLLAAIARALHHAHARRLIHRDIKPANILIDAELSTPYLADFGLAIHDEVCLPNNLVVGTPAYMSPEQARGEGHRLDGRSDVFSLGAVQYELLTGVKPFRGTSDRELRHQVINVEPVPPQEVDDCVPTELQRICLKALSKRASDRYATAEEMAEDLLNWQQRQHPHASEPQVVPRGLRSFDTSDADFFLDLLPGPRDRDNLPESVKFWKGRIEETNPENTFSVGLIYGPSGCGKSSLIKAGLLPRLSPNISTVYIEASATETPSRLLRALCRVVPALRCAGQLTETLSQVRRQDNHGKVLIVIDQFEQWLHVHGDLENEELVTALRQCDGAGLQCLLMIRDDFAMAAARFMSELDIPIVQGINFATVDLFAIDHAKKVLTKFGQAYGRLPKNAGDISQLHAQFVADVVEGLAQNGRVIPVRLALFAEMVKNRDWIPATLSCVGGAQGIGVTFLDESFISRSANPHHRMYLEGVRKVLAALLPDVGTDIKGHMQSHASLMELSGCTNEHGKFEQLLRILDGELRLITPTDLPDGRSGSGNDAKCYQLTHDYLVPAVREWLTRQQRESRRGRAQLRLTERSAIWNARPEQRQLPSLFEYLQIVCFTEPGERTEAQHRMMSAAAKALGFRWLTRGAVALALIIGVATLWNHAANIQRLEKLNGVVDQLLVANATELPNIADTLQSESETHPRLIAIASDRERDPGERLRALLSLPGNWDEHAADFVEFAQGADVEVISAIRKTLAPLPPELRDSILRALSGPATAKAKLRLAALLASSHVKEREWDNFASPVVDALVAETVANLDRWTVLLQPSSEELIPQLKVRFYNAKGSSAARDSAARVLASYADSTLLAELLANADSGQFSLLLSGAADKIDAVLAAMQKYIAASNHKENADAQIAWSRNVALSAIRFGKLDIAATYFGTADDPGIRTSLMIDAAHFGVTSEDLIDAYSHWTNPTARQAALLALEPFVAPGSEWPADAKLYSVLREILATSLYQTERSAAEWLLRVSEHEDIIDSVLSQTNTEIDSPDNLRGRDWWITAEGITMVIVPMPDANHDDEDHATERQSTQLHLAVSAHEVTMEQFKRFQPDAVFAGDVADDDKCPANKIPLSSAVEYCQWLSRQEGISEDQLVYDGETDLKQSSLITSAAARRRGYRLLTSDEWEYLCTTGVKTKYFFGNTDRHLAAFAWFNQNARERLHPVGSLRPNAFGLFDMTGNIAEWCHGSGNDRRFILRGGAFRDDASKLGFKEKLFQSPKGYSFTGFRVARSLPSSK